MNILTYTFDKTIQSYEGQNEALSFLGHKAVVQKDPDKNVSNRTILLKLIIFII